jgi:hypothetical protein
MPHQFPVTNQIAIGPEDPVRDLIRPCVPSHKTLRVFLEDIAAGRDMTTKHFPRLSQVENVLKGVSLALIRIIQQLWSENPIQSTGIDLEDEHSKGGIVWLADVCPTMSFIPRSTRSSPSAASDD